MRMVIVDTTLDGDLIGGGHLYLPKLIKGLVNHGHEVHLVYKGVPNQKIGRYLATSGAIMHNSIWNPNNYVEKTATRLAAWVNELKPDIYFISASTDIGWVALPFLEPGIATIAVGHTDSETFYLPAKHYHNFLTGLIGVSPQVREQYALNCEIPAERVFWIPYGVESAKEVPAINSNRIELVYVGRLEEEQKRISDIGKIIRELSSRNIDFHFRIVGDGPEMNSLKHSISTELKDGRVELMGWLEGNNVLEVMRSSHIFLLTSAYEGFCIALTEAMANGCCPIVTRIRSGNQELINNRENGFLVDIGDIKGFADLVEELATQRDQLENMRKAAWETGKNYNSAAMVNKYISCFTEIAGIAIKDRRQTSPGFPLMTTCRSKYPYWIRDIKVMAKNLRSKLFPA